MEYGDHARPRDAMQSVAWTTPCDSVIAFCASIGRPRCVLSPVSKALQSKRPLRQARAKPSNYPEPFFSRMSGREKRPLGDLFGLKNFGVNLTTLHPGGGVGAAAPAQQAG